MSVEEFKELICDRYCKFPVDEEANECDDCPLNLLSEEDMNKIVESEGEKMNVLIARDCKGNGRTMGRY